MPANQPEFGENDLPPPGGSDHETSEFGWGPRHLMEAFLKLRGRVRSSREPLDALTTHEVVLSELRAAALRFESFLASVLRGDVPKHLEPQLDSNPLLSDEVALREAVDAWRADNVENLALIAENVDLASRYQDLLDPGDLWDVCADVRWVETAFVEDLRAATTE